jgi:hypothetical protein
MKNRLTADIFLTSQYIHLRELDTRRKAGTAGSYVHIYDRKRKSENIVQTPVYYYGRERQMRTRRQLIFHPRVCGTRRGKSRVSDALT